MLLVGELTIGAVALAIWLFCLVDVATTRSSMMRLSKGWWFLILVVLGVLGASLWLFAGRPRRSSPDVVGRHLLVRYSMSRPKVSGGWPVAQQQVIGPDDDPEFLARMRVPSPEETELLNWWEADLERGGDEWPREDRT